MELSKTEDYTDKEMWKIVLADDQAAVRQGVKDWLEDEPDLEVVGEAVDGVDAVELTDSMKPDILITDLKMPRLDGIGVTKRVRQLSPDTRVIILSMYGNGVYVDAALNAGALGYVIKKSSADGLLDAIRAVADGKTYVSSASS